MDRGEEVVLAAFDRLFDRAATKLQVDLDDEEKAEAREDFKENFSAALKAADSIDLPQIPEEVMQAMEDAIDSLSPSQIVGHLASIPLAHQAQRLLQRIAYQAAERRLLEQLASQADETYGGN